MCYFINKPKFNGPNPHPEVPKNLWSQATCPGPAPMAPALGKSSTLMGAT